MLEGRGAIIIWVVKKKKKKQRQGRLQVTCLWLQRVGRDKEILGRGSWDSGPSSRLQLSVIIKMTDIYWATTVFRVPTKIFQCIFSVHHGNPVSTSDFESFLFMKKEMETRKDEHLPKVTECTHSPDLTTHWSHSAFWPDHPWELMLTSSSWRWHPSGMGAGDFALFSLCTRKEGKELWKQPTQKVEDRTDPEAQPSAQSIPPPPHHVPSSFSSSSFLSPGEDYPFMLFTNICGAQHNPELWKPLKMSKT